MKRALPALGLTAAGLALILNFQTRKAATGVQIQGGSLGDGANTPSMTAPSSTPETPTTVDNTPEQGSTTPTPDPTTPLAGPPVPSTTTTTEAPSDLSTTVTGPVANTYWGPVQVKVVIDKGKITDVVALQLPSHAAQSRWINDQAEPMLHDEALQAQSADLDWIGGATVTWQGYVASLQAALDETNF